MDNTIKKFTFTSTSNSLLKQVSYYVSNHFRISWDNLIKKMQLFGIKSSNNFFHISTLDIFESLLKKKLDIT